MRSEADRSAHGDDEQVVFSTDLPTDLRVKQDCFLVWNHVDEHGAAAVRTATVPHV